MACMEMTVADMSENDEVLRAFPLFLCETSQGIVADWRDFAKKCINLYGFNRKELCQGGNIRAETAAMDVAAEEKAGGRSSR